jgi:hypothetical protein
MEHRGTLPRVSTIDLGVSASKMRYLTADMIVKNSPLLSLYLHHGHLYFGHVGWVEPRHGLQHESSVSKFSSVIASCSVLLQFDAIALISLTSGIVTSTSGGVADSDSPDKLVEVDCK